MSSQYRMLTVRRTFVAATVLILEFCLGAPAPGDRSGALEVGGRTRTYFVHVPSHLDGRTPFPLVFVLHGGGLSPESAERMSGMSAKADKERFLAVDASATGRISRMLA